MELKGKDLYRVICTDSLSSDAVTSLMSLYQPLTGTVAVSLYLTLYSEGRKQRTQENHSRLSAIMNQSIDDLERARIALEEHLLLRCYVQEMPEKNQYIYLLNPPMNPASFLSSNDLRGELIHAIGQKQAELSANKFQTSGPSTSGYRDITRPVVRKSETRNYDVDVESSRIQPRYNFGLDDVSINFDYERFIGMTSPLVFPVELRTEENLRLIGKLATVNGLTPDRMRILTGRCINVGRNEFDAEKLKLMAEQSKPEIVTADDPYKLPPVSFLQSKQNGREVSLSDRRILRYLNETMNFPVEVINIMIEYILSVSQNRLVPKFVEMVAGEWARDGVATREDALKAAKKKKQNYTPRKQIVPEYMTGSENNKTEEKNETDAEEVLAMMRKLGNG